VKEELFGGGDILRMPADKKFSRPEFLSFQWNSTIVLEYFVEKMDLVGYQEIICSHPIDGLVFLSLHEDFPISDLPARHPMHLLKIYAHAERLRRHCFEFLTKKPDGIPEYLEDWSIIHFSHFFAEQKHDLKAALIALRYHWSFQKLLSIFETGAVSQAGVEGLCSEQDLLKIVQEVKELFGKVSRRSAKIKKQKAVAARQPPASSSVREEETVKPETVEGGEEVNNMKQPKPVTAMKKRKKTTSQTSITAARTENEEKEGSTKT